MAHFLIDGTHRLHVGLAPLPAQILGLHLEQFEHVKLKQGVLHFQGPLQDRRRFENNQHLFRFPIIWQERMTDQLVIALPNVYHADAFRKRRHLSFGSLSWLP